MSSLASLPSLRPMRSVDADEVTAHIVVDLASWVHDWSARSTELPQPPSPSISFTCLPLGSLYSHLPSWSAEVIYFICATRTNIQSPRAPDLWSVNHLAVLIPSPREQLLDSDACQSSATRQ